MATARGVRGVDGAERSDPPVQETLRRRALGIPSARSLLFTVLGEYVLPRGGEVWSSTLIDALSVLGVEEKSARQAMARTADDGWLSRERVGRRVRWRLTPPADDLLRTGAERIYGFAQRNDGWDGRWLVLFVADVPREAKHHLRTRLTWAGFGTLRPGVWVAAHPEREDEARRVLDEVGITQDAVSFVGTLGELGSPREVVAAAWDLDALEDRYEAFLELFADPCANDQESRFVSLTRLVHEWRRFPFLDPELPASLLPSRWSGRAAGELFEKRYATWKPAASEWFGSAALEQIL